MHSRQTLNVTALDRMLARTHQLNRLAEENGEGMPVAARLEILARNLRLDIAELVHPNDGRDNR